MEPRILVVDDDNLIRRIMRDTLVTIPATVLEATNGEEAIKIAKTERPDLIFLDTMMPGMDGFQTAEILKRDAATAPIPLLFVSALGTSSHKVRGLDMGAEDYISKPIDPEELKARVRSILRRTRPAPPPPEATALAVAKGQLQNMPLPSLIRWLEMERRSALLHLTRGTEEGEIVFQDGRITSAGQGPRGGDAAVYQLLTWDEGAFNINPPLGLPSAAATEVTAPNETLLDEGARRVGEIPGLRGVLPGADLLLEIPLALCAAVQADLPSAGVALTALVDGTRDIEGVLAESPLDALITLKTLHCLLRLGALGWEPRVGAAGQAAAGRRSIPRVTVEDSIEYQPLHPAEHSHQYTLSARGVFIQTPTPSEVGEQLLLRLQFPGSAIRLTAVGQVIWRNADAGQSKPESFGMGLQFVDLTADQLETVENRLTQSIAAEIRATLEKP
jgi:DNA-binding response OmpR family regulator/Tfp pilus assembly protein PilZ